MGSHEQSPPSMKRTVFAVAITLLFWSSAFTGIRIGLEGGYGAGGLVLLRFLSASLVFALYALVKRVPIPSKKDTLQLALLGISGISIYHIALTFGEEWVSAGTASLIIAAAPIFTALVSLVALRERLNALGWGGLALGFIGVAIITLGPQSSSHYLRGALLILLSAVSTAFYFVYQKPLLKRYGAIAVTAYVTWFGTVPMLWFTKGLFLQMPHASVAATIAVIYIGVFPAAIAYVAWAVALSGGRASGVSSALYLNPILAMIVAWFLLHEVPKWQAVLGGAVAILGVIVVNRSNTLSQRRGQRVTQVTDEERNSAPLSS